jgi:hypothetical protein
MFFSGADGQGKEYKGRKALSEFFPGVVKKTFPPDLPGVRKDHEGVRIDPGHQLL